MNTLTFWSSGQHGVGETNPWTGVAEETRVAILSKLHHKGPMTVKQLSDEMGFATSTIHRHIQKLLDLQLVKEVNLSEGEKRYRTEKYYTLAFPVFTQHDYDVLRPVWDRIAKDMAESVKKHAGELKEAFEETSFKQKGWRFENPEIKFALFTGASANEYLKKEGLLPEYPKRPGDNWWFLYGKEVTEKEMLEAIERRKAALEESEKMASQIEKETGIKPKSKGGYVEI